MGAVSGRYSRWRAEVSARWDRARQRNPWLDRLAEAVDRYHDRRVEYFALRVNLRGLFLAVTTMLVFIYVLGLVTDVLPGDNEITVPTVAVPTETDLGALIRNSAEGAAGRVLGLLGAASLAISAFYTARSLRQAADEIFNRPPAGKRMVRVRDALSGLAVAGLVLGSWLLALGTAVRTRVIVTITGIDVDRLAVDLGKIGLLLGSCALLTAAVYLPLRTATPNRRDLLIGSVAFGAFTTLANLILLYAYIGSIINPRTASGVVLVLTVLAWVSLVVRALFLMQCWVVAGPRSTT